MSNILVVPDTHYPFQHIGITDFVRDAIRQYDIDEVLFTGDILDQYASSLFKKSPYAKSASDELKAAQKDLKKLYKAIGDLPTRIVLGNHDNRHLKRGMEVNLPNEMMLGLKQLIEAPAHYKFGSKFKLPGNIHTEHGEGYSGQSAPLSLIRNIRTNVIIGHLHSQFSITYNSNGDMTLWALIAGCMIDVDSYAFQYGSTMKDKPVCGLSVISNGVPILIPVG